MKKDTKYIDGVFTTVTEQDDSTKRPRTVKVTVKSDAQGVYILPDGYNDMGDCGIPVMLEMWKGKLRLVVWADIMKEDPTHIIDLEGARANNPKLKKLRKEMVRIEDRA